jgi:hypothetical protein
MVVTTKPKGVNLNTQNQTDEPFQLSDGLVDASDMSANPAARYASRVSL